MSSLNSGAGTSGSKAWWMGTPRPNVFHASGGPEEIERAAKHAGRQLGTSFAPLHVYVDGQHYATIDNSDFCVHEPSARERMS